MKNLSIILDNIWKDSKKIKFKSEISSFGVSVSLGLIGYLASGLEGVGILTALGYNTLDKILDIKLESISEKIAKIISPNYLVSIYDFKGKHNIKD